MKVFAPAKLNLFLKIINKRKDGYHNISSGVTFLNLFNEINISTSHKNYISYSGPFAPSANLFDDDIINKILEFLYNKNRKKFFVNIKIKKNIPYGAGLGSGSADAGGLLRGLKRMGLVNFKIDYNKISSIGSDIPMCLESKDCIAEGIGEKILLKNNFPKYYFILVKPNFSFSSKEVYSRFKFIKNNGHYFNDLEPFAIKINSSLNSLIFDLSKLEGSLFSRMSGSGSCCYAAFNNHKYATNGLTEIKAKHASFWSCLVSNKIESEFKY